MKVSDYLPNLYNNNLEMLNIIYSEEEELENNLKPDIENSFIDNFATKATEKGISNFENIFKIKPNVNTETIEFRRARVMNRLVSQIPFSERYLIDKLNSMLGEGNWSYEIDYNDYTLEVYSLIPGRGWYNELLIFLSQVVPCNIAWTVTVYSATWSLVNDNFSTWQTIYDRNITWQQLMDAEWLN